MSSIYTRSDHAGCLVYSACKGALESATRSLARESGHRYNATVNFVCANSHFHRITLSSLAQPKGACTMKYLRATTLACSENEVFFSAAIWRKTC